MGNYLLYESSCTNLAVASCQGEPWGRALCAMPNLCVSTLMLVTPSTAKSKGGTRWPSFREKGSTKPPRQASLWQHTPARAATCTRDTVYGGMAS